MKMRSCSSHGSDKSVEPPSRKDKKYITFDYNNNLQCFITSSSQALPKANTAPIKRDKKLKTNPAVIGPSVSNEKNSPLAILRVPRHNKGKMGSKVKNPFGNSVLLLEYEAEEELKQEVKPDSIERPKESASQEEDQVVTAIVNSCMRVITEDTEHSSNPISARYTPQTSSTPTNIDVNMNMNLNVAVSMMPYIGEEYYYYYNMKGPSVRNRRAVSNEESKVYVIDLEKVVTDGRTTIMVRNIPNKYTQDMLLELFQKNHKKKFDFFYLPIDYNNNCNVGYAFLNFIHTKFIIDFYNEFHQRKWNKFNSVKVCQVCYARIQGTAQLEHHFEHSNVLQQRDRRFRPLIGLKSLQENISSLVQKQKHEHASEEPNEP